MKRRMLQAAVAENLDIIRGLPPRALRRSRSLGRLWARRAALVALPLMFAGSTYLATSTATPPAAPPPVVARQASIAPVAVSSEIPSTERVAASAFPLSVRRVVLDAGHGGSDPGATAEDLLEKEVTLDINRRLRTMLQSAGFEVIVTRNDDRTIALKERAALANRQRSDVFVSIHVNAITKHTQSRGVETYYLGPTDDQRLTALAAAENRVSGYSMTDMRRLLDNVYADARGDESRELATVVQHQLYTTLRAGDPGLENWGVKRAPFLVLVSTEMPAILAEVGCISNAKEAAMLRRPEHRRKIAEALFAGIRAYASANDAPRKKGI